MNMSICSLIFKILLIALTATGCSDGESHPEGGLPTISHQQLMLDIAQQDENVVSVLRLGRLPEGILKFNFTRNDLKNYPDWQIEDDRRDIISIEEAVAIANRELKNYVSVSVNWDLHEVKLLRPFFLTQRGKSALDSVHNFQFNNIWIYSVRWILDVTNPGPWYIEIPVLLTGKALQGELESGAQR